MIVRVLLFAAWAAVGAVASYGFLYLATPYGLMILGTCLFAGLALPERGGSRWPEVLGLVAGPGLLLMYAGGDAAAVGSALVAAVLVGYALAGRSLCARA